MSKEKKLKIIDPHVHLWDLALNYHDWLNNTESSLLGLLTPLRQNYLQDNYLHDSRNFSVEQLVHIEASSTKYARQEVQCLEDHCGGDSFLGAVVAGIDLMVLPGHIKIVLRQCKSIL